AAVVAGVSTLLSAVCTPSLLQAASASVPARPSARVRAWVRIMRVSPFPAPRRRHGWYQRSALAMVARLPTDPLKDGLPRVKGMSGFRSARARRAGVPRRHPWLAPALRHGLLLQTAGSGNRLPPPPGVG